MAGFDKYGVDVELQRLLARRRTTTPSGWRSVWTAYRQLLENILTVNAALVGQRQNEETKRLTEASLAQSEEVKKVSAWAAILFAPTVIGTVYGMNFDHMPELNWVLGYPFALGLMLMVSVVLYTAFKLRRWL